MSTVVYRIYDVNGVLLYVGCSISLGTRIAAHVAQKDWSAEIADVKVEQFQSVFEAQAAETRAILVEKPKYNKALTTPIVRRPSSSGALKAGRPRLGEVRDKPWIAAGMSRRTWYRRYRRKAEARGAKL